MYAVLRRTGRRTYTPLASIPTASAFIPDWLAAREGRPRHSRDRDDRADRGRAAYRRLVLVARAYDSLVLARLAGQPGCGDRPGCLGRCARPTRPQAPRTARPLRRAAPA